MQIHFFFFLICIKAGTLKPIQQKNIASAFLKNAKPVVKSIGFWEILYWDENQYIFSKSQLLKEGPRSLSLVFELTYMLVVKMVTFWELSTKLNIWTVQTYQLWAAKIKIITRWQQKAWFTYFPLLPSSGHPKSCTVVHSDSFKRGKCSWGQSNVPVSWESLLNSNWLINFCIS